jgi:hypothetical protein
MAAAAASLSFTASAARRSAHVSAPSRCYRGVEYLLMPKAMDFTSISMRASPGSCQWTSRSGRIAHGRCWRGAVLEAQCLSGLAARPPLPAPSSAVKHGRGRGIEGLPLFVGEAAHRDRGMLSVGEGARARGPTGAVGAGVVWGEYIYKNMMEIRL